MISYILLEYGDIIKKTDEYYNPYKDEWFLVEDEFIGREFDIGESKPTRRQPETLEEIKHCERMSRKF